MKDKKQTVQLIVLGVLVAVCVGVVTVMMLPKKQSGPPPAQAKVPDAAKPAVSAVEAPIGAGPSAPAAIVPDVLMAKSGQGRDPFSPAMDISVHLAQNPVASPGSRLKPVGTQMVSVPRLGGWTEPGGEHLGTGSGGKLPVTPNVSGAEPAGQTLAPPQKPAFVLTGVITGDANVAIIRLNENRYIVREGQMVDGKYLVVKVTGHNVTLARGGQDIVLELGG